MQTQQAKIVDARTDEQAIRELVLHTRANVLTILNKDLAGSWVIARDANLLTPEGSPV
jgi:hypothetical protein